MTRPQPHSRGSSTRAIASRLGTGGRQHGVKTASPESAGPRGLQRPAAALPRGLSREQSRQPGQTAKRGVGIRVTFPGSGPASRPRRAPRRPLTPGGRRTYPAASLGVHPFGQGAAAGADCQRNVPCVPAPPGIPCLGRAFRLHRARAGFFHTLKHTQNIQTRARTRRDGLPMTTTPMQRDAILHQAVELGASDLLITAGHPVMVTVAGVLQPLPGIEPLTPMESRRLAESFLNPVLNERFVRDLELDTRCFLPGVAHFRVNLFIQRGHWGAAVRVVPLRIPLPSELGLPPHVVSRVLGIARGLVLVTGPTGAGKSTTIAALLEQLNQQGLRRHIVTVEDPIEFVFEAKNAVFEQREVGTDTKSYARGLRGALRQMPNVIFVG
ncbi:MAG: hypothetical protein E4H17_04660, partial [Gemmatimonadales bacterium]